MLFRLIIKGLSATADGVGRESADRIASEMGTKKEAAKWGCRRDGGGRQDGSGDDGGEVSGRRDDGAGTMATGGVGIQKTGVSQSGTPEIRYISTN